jgi:hypothetical protein
MPTVGNTKFPYTPEGKRTSLENLEELYDKVHPLVEKFETKSQDFRTRRTRIWKRLDNYWNDLQYSFWDENQGSYSTVNGVVIPGEESIDESPRQANIIKAHGESIIAALSAGIPNAQFFPENAEDAEDVNTAKAYSIISDIIQSHNNFGTLFVKLLHILWNQDFAAVWNYTHQDKKYGTFSRPGFRTEQVEIENYSCPECGSSVDMPKEEEELAVPYCRDCEKDVAPKVSFETTSEQVPTLEPADKSRVLLRAFGPRNVEIPSYVKSQDETPYLTLRIDYASARMRAVFPDFYDKIKDSEVEDDNNEAYLRQHYDDSRDAQDTVIVKIVWIRNWAFNKLEKADAEELKKQFPSGGRFTFISNHLVEAIEEDLDDHWTITQNPLSDHLHANPMGHSLMDIQDMTNDLINITDQTIHHGVSEVFADPDVVDFDQYGRRTASPGQMTPAKPLGGRGLGDAFYATKPSMLSREVGEFGEALKEMGQFVSGALPSIFGGANVGGSDTAAEYSMSRSNALQRLSTYYKMLSEFMVEVLHKSVLLYIETMQEKETFVKPQGNNFVNIWVTREQTQGNVGRVTVEGSDNLPSSWMQKRDLIMSLMDKGNPQIDAVLYSPQNSTIVKSILGIEQLEIPGEDSRNKQYAEIEVMLDEVPRDEQTSSLPIIPDVDDDAVEFAVCKSWLQSPQGQETRKFNPPGYMNVLLHCKAHKDNLMAQTQGPDGRTNEGEAPESDEGKR